MTTPSTVNMLTVTHTDEPAFNTRSHAKRDSPDTTPHPDMSPKISSKATPIPKPLTVDRWEALLQMQRTDPFRKRISKHLLNDKAPQHETDLFTQVKGLLYKHIMDSGKVSCPCYPKILEVYSLGRSSQQTRTSRNLPYLLFNKKTISLEENEQRH